MNKKMTAGLVLGLAIVLGLGLLIGANLNLPAFAQGGAGVQRASFAGGGLESLVFNCHPVSTYWHGWQGPLSGRSGRGGLLDPCVRIYDCDAGAGDGCAIGIGDRPGNCASVGLREQTDGDEQGK